MYSTDPEYKNKIVIDLVVSTLLTMREMETKDFRFICYQHITLRRRNEEEIEPSNNIHCLLSFRTILYHLISKLLVCYTTKHD